MVAVISAYLFITCGRCIDRNSEVAGGYVRDRQSSYVIDLIFLVNIR